MKVLIPVLFLLSISGNLYAQNFEFSGEFGYGSTYLDDHISFKEFFGQSSVTNLGGGIYFAYNPGKTCIFLTSGIKYILKGDRICSFNNLRIPLGIKIEPGRKVRYIIGGGVYLNYLFYTKGNIDPDVKNTFRDFQFGGFFETGLKYNFYSCWNIFLLAQIWFDLSPMYMNEIPFHGGTHGTEAIRSYDLTFNLGCSYMIPVRGTGKISACLLH